MIKKEGIEINIKKYNLQLVKDKEYNYELKDMKIKRATDADRLIREVFSLDKQSEEVMAMMTLDVGGNITGFFEVSRGSIDASLVNPREIFKRAILQNAKGIIIAHNHPSGEIEPSFQDEKITEKLEKAGEILDINLYDHIIVGNLNESFYSFRREGKLG